MRPDDALIRHRMNSPATGSYAIRELGSILNMISAGNYVLELRRVDYDEDACVAKSYM